MQASLLDIATVLLVLAALFSWLNYKVLRLPFTIGLTVSGLVAAALVLMVDVALPGLGVSASVRAALALVDFPASLMRGMLGFLLFAGALHVNLDELISDRWTIGSLATVGVVISTVLTGAGAWFVFGLVGLPVPLVWCLVFGALIAPTDPIAVLGLMQSLGAPPALRAKVAGESLFNDGLGVVAFSLLLTVAGGGAHGGGEGMSTLAAGLFFIQEVGGGILLGLAAGALVYAAMRHLDEPNTEVLLSFALVAGMTMVASRLHLSSPLACVVAGLLLGNHGRRFAMSDATTRALDVVWEFVDHSLNGVLFLLVGLEVMATVSPDPRHLVAGAAAVAVALAARLISVSVPIKLLSLRQKFMPGIVTILTWGGLKGGISIALALSLPAFPGRSVVLTATAIIVAFSVVVQGLTIGPLIRHKVAGTGPAA